MIPLPGGTQDEDNFECIAVVAVVGRTLLLKEGRIRVTDVRNPNLYLALSTLKKKVGLDYIRSHLFPEYTSRRTRRIEQQHVATARLQRVDESATAALRGLSLIHI